MNRKVVWLLLLVILINSCSPPKPIEQIQTDSVVPTVTGSEVSDSAGVTETISVTQTVEKTKVATQTIEPTQTIKPITIEEVIEYEMKGSFNFFWEQANLNLDSAGFGLIRDRYPGSEGISSIASVGFGLTAYLIGIEKGYITYQDGYDRVNHTLDTLLAMNREQGFFYHFVDMTTGKRAWNSEVSSIDTSILMMGVLSVGEYFGGEIQTKAKQLYDEVNWTWFLDEAKNMFYMAYRPEKGFEGYWDFYAEQLMLYVLAAGSDTFPIDETPYYAFTRHYAKYGPGNPFIHSWFGSIFTYQFSHAWIDFRNYTDKKGVNWFDNSIEASLAQFNFAAAMEHKYNTLGSDAWGLSACDGPNGYNGLYGAPPSGYDNKQHFIDDTIPPYGAIGSIIFLPTQAEQAMLYYYSLDELQGQYGFLDSFNLSEDWFASDVIGIDKGITLLMLANYEDNLVYDIMMKNEQILQGLDRLQITPND